MTSNDIEDYKVNGTPYILFRCPNSQSAWLCGHVLSSYRSLCDKCAEWLQNDLNTTRSTLLLQGRITQTDAIDAHASVKGSRTTLFFGQTPRPNKLPTVTSPKVTLSLVINSIKAITLARISGSSLDTCNNNVQPSVAVSQHPPWNYVLKLIILNRGSLRVV